MSKKPSANLKSNYQTACSLLAIEHRQLVQWLHDELAQNLVAIKSFANLLIEQSLPHSENREQASLIRQAAESAYDSSYDLMQELKAEEWVALDIEAGMELCLKESRLKQYGIDYALQVNIGKKNRLDDFSKAIVLRSLRSFINYGKRNQQSKSILVNLGQSENELNIEMQLRFQDHLDSPIDTASGKLTALCQRIEAIGGNSQISSQQADSLNLNLTIPTRPKPMEIGL